MRQIAKRLPPDWWDGLRDRRDTPDFKVGTAFGEVLLEIKPASIACRPAIRLRHRLIRESLRARGVAFVVWVERHHTRGAEAAVVPARLASMAARRPT